MPKYMTATEILLREKEYWEQKRKQFIELDFFICKAYDLAFKIMQKHYLELSIRAKYLKLYKTM